jgi:hypothetical protein
MILEAHWNWKRLLARSAPGCDRQQKPEPLQAELALCAWQSEIQVPAQRY